MRRSSNAAQWGIQVPKSKMRIPELGGFQAIKLGSGVLGKTAPLMGGVLILAVVTITALRNADPLLVAAIFAFTLLVVVAYIIYAFWYGRKYPAEALLEGGELIRYREMDLATNDPKVIDISPAGAENAPPPASLRGGDTI